MIRRQTIILSFQAPVIVPAMSRVSRDPRIQLIIVFRQCHSFRPPRLRQSKRLVFIRALSSISRLVSPLASKMRRMGLDWRGRTAVAVLKDNQKKSQRSTGPVDRWLQSGGGGSRLRTLSTTIFKDKQHRHLNLPRKRRRPTGRFISKLWKGLHSSHTVHLPMTRSVQSP